MFKSVLFFLILIFIVLLVIRFGKKDNNEGYGCGSGSRRNPEMYGSDLVFVYEGNSPNTSVGIW